MREQEDLLGELHYRGSDDDLPAAFADQVKERRKRTGRQFPSVELHLGLASLCVRIGTQQNYGLFHALYVFAGLMRLDCQI